jgi:hypothetical protein
MLTTALNTLVSLRTAGYRLMHLLGLEGVGPLLAGLALIGVIIWALSRLIQGSD